MSPVELVRPFADRAMQKGMIQPAESDYYHVEPYEDLNQLARVFSIVNQQYVVNAHRGLVLPENSRNPPVHMDAANFTGELVGYSEIRPPRHLGDAAIMGVCLSFANVTIHPFEEVITEAVLHVAVLQAYGIDRLVA